jgi:hypothetical protein
MQHNIANVGGGSFRIFGGPCLIGRLAGPRLRADHPDRQRVASSRVRGRALPRPQPCSVRFRRPHVPAQVIRGQATSLWPLPRWSARRERTTSSTEIPRLSTRGWRRSRVLQEHLRHLASAKKRRFGRQAPMRSTTLRGLGALRTRKPGASLSSVRARSSGFRATAGRPVCPAG